MSILFATDVVAKMQRKSTFGHLGGAEINFKIQGYLRYIFFYKQNKFVDGLSNHFLTKCKSIVIFVDFMQ